MDRLEYRQRLAELLQQELSSTRRLLLELERQQRNLASAEAELIEASASASHQHIQALDALEKKRQTLASRLGYRNDNEGMEQLIRWCDYDGSLAQQWRKLLETARQCRDCNHANGTVVDISRRRVRQALGILRGQMSDAELYGRSGQTAADTLSRPLAKA